MKNLLKSLLLAASVFMLLAGCNQIGVSDATVDGGAAYTDGVCYLTISVDDMADLIEENRSVSRTINPVSFEGTGDANVAERKKLTTFVLKGVSESTGAELGEDGAGLPLTFELVNPEDSNSEKKTETKVAIPYGAWELTLIAKDADGRALLQGQTFANLKTAKSEVEFTLKTDGLTNNGGVNLAGTFVDTGKIAKSYAAGLYDTDTGVLIENTSVFGNVAENDPSFSFNPKTGSDSYIILPGRYSFQVQFYSKALKDGGVDPDSKMVGFWEDTVVVDPGRITLDTSISCGNIIYQKPKSPENLRAYYKVDAAGKPDDSRDGYTVILTWDDKSNNEENFVITIDEYEPAVAPATGLTIKTGSTTKLGAGKENDTGIVPFFANKDYYVGGSVHASSTTASIRLPHGKYFEISIQAENFVGLSDAKDDEDGEQACTRVTTVYTAGDPENNIEATGVTPAPANGSLVTSEKINRYAINYDLGDGTLTLQNGNKKNGVYSVYGSIYDFAEDADLKLSTILLKTKDDDDNPTNVLTSLDGYAFEKWVKEDGSDYGATEELDYKGIKVKAVYDNKTLISYTINNKYFTIKTAVEYDDDGEVLDDTVDTTKTGVEKNKDLKFTVTAVNADKTENTTLKIEKLSVKITNYKSFLKSETIPETPANSCTCTLSTENLDGGNHTVIVTAVVGGKTYQNTFPLVYVR